MIIEIFPSKRVEGDKKTEIRIPSIDYARTTNARHDLFFVLNLMQR